MRLNGFSAQGPGTSLEQLAKEETIDKSFNCEPLQSFCIPSGGR